MSRELALTVDELLDDYEADLKNRRDILVMIAECGSDLMGVGVQPLNETEAIVARLERIARTRVELAREADL